MAAVDISPAAALHRRAKYPTPTALLYEGQEFSAARLSRTAIELAAGLAEQGLRRGDRRHVVDAALRSGDSVTAFARNPAALGDLARQITVATGDATSCRDVSAAAAGQDAIVSALGRGTSIRAGGLFTRAAAAVLHAAEEQAVSRLVWLSSFGVGHTFDWSSTTQKAIYRTLLRSLYADKAMADDHIRSSGLDWTIVLPTRLTDGPAKGTFSAGDRLPMKGNPTISRADVAAFMYEVAQGGEWVHASPVITG